MSKLEQLEELYKFGHLEPSEQAFHLNKVFSREKKKGVPQICVASSIEQVAVLDTLLEYIPEPLWLLYVLVVPRGEGEAGRYQSAEPMTREQIRTFLQRFRNFLESDGRCNLWLKSESGPDLLVLDRHNLIYGYGPIDQWALALHEMGWSEVDMITLPDPHSHHYHAIFDDDAQQLLSCVEWHMSPLREQDNS